MAENEYIYDFSGLGSDSSGEDKNSLPPIADGEYEVNIEKVEKKTYTNQNGITTKQISLKYRIRKDVNQSFDGRVIFDNIGEDQLTPGAYDHIKLNRILGYGFDHNDPEIHKQIAAIKTSDMIVQFLNGMNIRIKTEQKKNNEGVYYKFPNIVKYMPTQAGAVSNDAGSEEDPF